MSKRQLYLAMRACLKASNEEMITGLKGIDNLLSNEDSIDRFRLELVRDYLRDVLDMISKACGMIEDFERADMAKHKGKGGS